MEKKEKLKYSVMVGFIVLTIFVGNAIGYFRTGRYRLTLGVEQVVVYFLCVCIAAICVYFINKKRQ